MKIVYAPVFVRQFDKLESGLQEEVLEKIELFRDIGNHKILKIHKLHGRLQDRYSFSVNYKIRIVFVQKDGEYWFLSIGSHDIYN